MTQVGARGGGGGGAPSDLGLQCELLGAVRAAGRCCCFTLTGCPASALDAQVTYTADGVVVTTAAGEQLACDAGPVPLQLPPLLLILWQFRPHFCCLSFKIGRAHV